MQSCLLGVFLINNGHCQPSDFSSAFRCQKAAWGQVDVFCCILSEPQGFCRISPVEEHEHVVCRLVVELWPRIGVDVVHHPVARVLSEFNAHPLLEYPSYLRMVSFAERLLLRRVWGAVIDSRRGLSVFASLYGFRIGKLAAPVCEYDREQTGKKLHTQSVPQSVHRLGDIGAVLIVLANT